LVVANSCALRAERVALLTLLSAQVPGFVRGNPPRSTNSITALPLAPEARQFFVRVSLKSPIATFRGWST
jgi:hypothetical protein